MSYQGFGAMYGGPDTVDEVADYTDMMGSASVANQRVKGMPWNNDATKALLWLWAFVMLVYWMFAFFFRQYLV
jgi:hypothetical protein